MSDSKEATDIQRLQVEAGGHIVLSPESRRFQDNYRRVQPRTADEVREIIGLSMEAARALHERGEYPQVLERPSVTVLAEELDSLDDRVRARALNETGHALKNYVFALNPTEVPRHMKAVFVRYLELSGVVLNIVVLPDIEVADGGTLTISNDTHFVEANRVTIHGTGRIVCGGYTKFVAASIQGV